MFEFRILYAYTNFLFYILLCVTLKYVGYILLIDFQYFIMIFIEEKDLNDNLSSYTSYSCSFFLYNLLSSSYTLP